MHINNSITYVYHGNVVVTTFPKKKNVPYFSSSASFLQKRCICEYVHIEYIQPKKNLGLGRRKEDASIPVLNAERRRTKKSRELLLYNPIG